MLNVDRLESGLDRMLSEDVIDKDQYLEELYALEAAAQYLWAVEVLDAYAMAGPRPVPQVEPDRRRGTWSIYVWVGNDRKESRADTIEAARISAAEIVFPTLSDEDRARIKERPWLTQKPDAKEG